MNPLAMMHGRRARPCELWLAVRVDSPWFPAMKMYCREKAGEWPMDGGKSDFVPPQPIDSDFTINFRSNHETRARKWSGHKGLPI